MLSITLCEQLQPTMPSILAPLGLLHMQTCLLRQWANMHGKCLPCTHMPHRFGQRNAYPLHASQLELDKGIQCTTPQCS